ncbi:MAG: acyl-CoA thioesterase [Sphingobacteriales bacterium]|jgi:acyl-CoA thioesterase
MDAKEKAGKVVDTMMEHDFYSQWLGIKVLETGEGISKLHMTVRKEMLNGFGIAHGAITYALADSALAFSANSHGVKSVSVETSISHIAGVKEGDQLTATATEIHKSRKIGVYDISVSNQNNEKVALFKGTVYRTSKEWDV